MRLGIHADTVVDNWMQPYGERLVSVQYLIWRD